MRAIRRRALAVCLLALASFALIAARGSQDTPPAPAATAAAPPAPAAKAAQAPAQPTITNPIVTGNLPDPSVARRGGDYYMVSTDTDPPYFPIYHSTDLRTWTFAGNVLEKLPRWSRGKTWAPEIRFWQGKWRVYYAAGRRGGRMCIARASSVRPEGPYRDEGPVVCPRQGAIDPYLMVRDGAPWLVFKVMGAYSPIVARRLDHTGRRVVGPPITLIHPERGWEEVTTEGPNVVRHGGWWYLFYSGGHCCTPPCTYKLGVARSRSALGPYLRSDEPVLVSNDQVACPGHGTLFNDGGGDWYMVHHGFVDGSGQRMPILSTVQWEDDGWPEVNDGFGALRDLSELAELTAAKAAGGATP